MFSPDEATLHGYTRKEIETKVDELLKALTNDDPVWESYFAVYPHLRWLNDKHKVERRTDVCYFKAHELVKEGTL